MLSLSIIACDIAFNFRLSTFHLPFSTSPVYITVNVNKILSTFQFCDGIFGAHFQIWNATGGENVFYSNKNSLFLYYLLRIWRGSKKSSLLVLL